MSGLVILLYLLGCLLVAAMARETSLGFLGQFLLSLVMSPVIGLLLFLLFRPDRKTRAALLRMKLGEHARSGYSSDPSGSGAKAGRAKPTT